MTSEELSKALAQADLRVTIASKNVIDLARSAVLTLKDHNANTLAAELERLIHVYDCETEEHRKLVTENPVALFGIVLRARTSQ